MTSDVLLDGPKGKIVAPYGRGDVEACFRNRGAMKAAIERLRLAEEKQDERTALFHARRHRHLAQAGHAADAAAEAALAQSLSRPDTTPDVELELAARSAALGSDDEAETRYAGVLEALGDHSALGAIAAFRLALMRLERDERREALALLERALCGADESLRPHVLISLADELRARKRHELVEELYAAALATDHPDLAPRAALKLGGLREERGDYHGAVELYELVIGAEHADLAPVAAARRNALVHGRTARAIEAMLLLDTAEATGQRHGHSQSADDGQAGPKRDAGAQSQRGVSLLPGEPGGTLSLLARSLPGLFDRFRFGWHDAKEPDAQFDVERPDVPNAENGGERLGRAMDMVMFLPALHNHRRQLELRAFVFRARRHSDDEPPSEECSGGCRTGTNRLLLLSRELARQDRPVEPERPCMHPPIAPLATAPMLTPWSMLGAGADHNPLISGSVTRALSLLRCEQALITGTLVSSPETWSAALDARDPLVLEWQRAHERCLCDCCHRAGPGGKAPDR